jgi:long-subunit fatty acid transport protein
MGNIGHTFGLSANDVGSAQANAFFQHGPSTVYYNPANLAKGKHSEILLSYLYADPALKISSRGGPNPADRSGGDIAFSDDNQTILLGMKVNFNDLLKSERGLGFGLMLGLDDNANSLFSVNDASSETGQFLQYGQKPLFFALSMGLELSKGIAIGAGTHISIAAEAPVELESTLAGDTSRENIQVQSRTDFASLSSLSIDWAKIGCDDAKACAVTGLETVLSYREASGFRLDLDANAVIPGTINPPGLDLIVAAVDGYQPTIISFAARYPLSASVSMAYAFEQQQWSELSEILQRKAVNGNAIKDNGNAQFEDTQVHRLALLFNNIGDLPFGATLDASLGYAYEPSALKDGPTPDINLLDNDRQLIAAGLSLTWHRTRFFSHPITFDLAYQHHLLSERQFELWSTPDTLGASPEYTETVSSKGNVNVVNFGITARF